MRSTAIHACNTDPGWQASRIFREIAAQRPICMRK